MYNVPPTGTKGTTLNNIRYHPHGEVHEPVSIKGMAIDNVEEKMELNKNTCTESVETKSSAKINLEKSCVGMLFDERRTCTHFTQIMLNHRDLT